MKRLENLPTRSEWISRLKYFDLHQDECLQGFLHIRLELLDAYHFVFDTVTMSVSIPCGGFRVYQQSLEFDSFANALAFEYSMSIFINFILQIDFDFFSIDVLDILEVNEKYRLILSLKTTLEVCA